MEYERLKDLIEREEAKEEEKKNKCGCSTVLLLKMKVKSFFQKRRKTNLKKKELEDMVEVECDVGDHCDCYSPFNFV